MLRLRSDLVVKGATLHDPVLERDINLAGIAAELVKRLDGTRSVDAIAAELGAPVDRVEASLRRLLHLNLVEGAGTETLERIARLRRGDERLKPLMLPETRFGCIGSGDCCQSYSFGPLADNDIELLARLPIREHFPHLTPPYWHERKISDRDTARFLNAVDNRCVFLRDDCHCGLHVTFGAANKPGLCQTYPFEAHATVDGYQVYNIGGCSEYSTTARSGALLIEQLPSLLPLMRSGLFSHPLVILGDQVAVDYSYVHPVLDAALEGVRAGGASPPEHLRALSRRLLALRAALLRCPLTPSGPAEATAEALAPSEAWFAPGDSREGAAAIARLAATLAQGVVDIIGLEEPSQPREHYSGRQSKELIPILHLLVEVASHVVDSKNELSAYTSEVADADVSDPELDEVLRISLRESLFGGGALLSDRTDAGLARLAFVQLVTLWGGRLRAVQSGRARVTPKDLDRPHMLATRVMGLRWIVQRFEGGVDAPAILEALPALARWR
jgi:Fe-S-cluster containining protein